MHVLDNEAVNTSPPYVPQPGAGCPKHVLIVLTIFSEGLKSICCYGN